MWMEICRLTLRMMMNIHAGLVASDSHVNVVQQ